MAIGTNCHLGSKHANTRLIYSKFHQTTRVGRSQCVLKALGKGISCHRGCGTNVTGGFWLQPSMKHGFHHVKLCETLYVWKSQDPHSRTRPVSCVAPSKTAVQTLLASRASGHLLSESTLDASKARMTL